MHQFVQSENILFPKKIREVNEEISEIEKEINTLKAAKLEANEEFEHLHVSKKTYSIVIKSS